MCPTLCRTLCVYCLEMELLEEPLDSVVQILLSEDLSCLLKCCLLFSRVAHGLDDVGWVDLLEEIVILEDVPGNEEVVAVDCLNKALDLCALHQLLLGHCLGDLLRGLLDAENDGVRVFARLSRLGVSLEDNSLLAGVAALEEDDKTPCGDHERERPTKTAYFEKNRRSVKPDASNKRTIRYYQLPSTYLL